MSEQIGIYSSAFQAKKKREYDRKPVHPGSLGLIRAVKAVVPFWEPIIDLGAGTGRHVKMLRDVGYQVYGVDGTENVDEITGGLVQQFDLLKGSPNDLPGPFDWGLFYDVGEHIPREQEQELIDNICKIPRRGLIISWGYPHERGAGHINCRTQVYIAHEFARRGLLPNDEMTQAARDASKFDRHYIRLFVAVRNG